jgi:hypothetical protein
MLRFHQLILGDSRLSPARALREAAKWLRQATRQELDALAQTGLTGIRPIPADETDLARDVLRGVSGQEGIATLLEEELPEFLRLPAAKALGKFRLVDGPALSSMVPNSFGIVGLTRSNLNLYYGALPIRASWATRTPFTLLAFS